MRWFAAPIVAACAFALAACQSENSGGNAAGASGGTVPGDTEETDPYSGIAENEVLRFTGTEPFWGGEVNGTTLIYSTPENQEGTTIEVERFAGRGGIAFGGSYEGAMFEMMVTPLACSDGMSDRTYPFTVTLQIGEETRSGCAWSEEHPFEGPEHP